LWQRAKFEEEFAKSKTNRTLGADPGLDRPEGSKVQNERQTTKMKEMKEINARKAKMKGNESPMDQKEKNETSKGKFWKRKSCKI